MKSFLKKILILILALTVSVCALSGCNMHSGNVVVSIEKTASTELSDTYTITYSDGTTETIEIKHGKDGVDGQDGARGEKGDPGQDGVDGIDGTDGEPGQDGAPGQDGKDGIDGVDGKDGKDGQDLVLDQVFEKWLTENPGKTYDDFVAELLNVSVGADNSLMINRALSSTAKLYTEFYELNYGYVVNARYTGSAVIYKIDADYTYFITNYHVLYDASAISGYTFAKRIIANLYGSEGAVYDTDTTDEMGGKIYDYGDYGIECEYVGGSAAKDIALIKAPTPAVKAVNEDILAIEFADEFYIGETAVAIGNPSDRGISVTQGIVSMEEQDVELSVGGQNRYYSCMRIDTSIYGGSSGGGLFNKYGKLIGITNGGAGSVEQNINYAIPFSIVKSTVESIMNNYNGSVACSPTTFTLGITASLASSKYVYDAQSGYGSVIEQIKLASVNASSPANAMGLQAEDLIISIFINDTEYKITKDYILRNALMSARENDFVKVKYSRGGVQTVSNSYKVMAADISAV